MRRRSVGTRRRVVALVANREELGRVLADACDDFLDGVNQARQINYRGRTLLVQSKVFPWSLTVHMLLASGDPQPERGAA